ncbi:MAG: serine dehydratase subunit alpha family protein [Bacteroidaceae bacterium]|nr:serine dehydratase subunit alpha family protein [Bacteroidaceae bacterium]
MLTNEQRNTYLALLHREVVPAIGCTEPMAVALCVARATEKLGTRPMRIDLRLSANILKNAMGVGIPGTGGMIGLPIAVAMGAIGGKSCLGLEVLRDCTDDDLAAAKRYIAEDHIHISLEEHDPDKLFIHVSVSAGDRHEEACIKGGHTKFVENYEKPLPQPTNEKEPKGRAAGCAEPSLTLHAVYEFVTTSPLDDLRFILEAKHLNEAAAQEGLRENYGHQLGKTMCSPLGRGIMGDSIFAKVLSETSCACDARMAGAKIPVMSNSGSGNQGICATMPVVVFARENHNTEEELIRALTLSHLTAIYIKQSLGCLSALCGCVVASTGSSCGITYLMGGTYEQIAYSVKNMVANLTGMICDGAKPSCALKLTTGVGTAVMSAMLAIQHKYVTSAEGIIDDDVDRSIHNLTSIGSRGMDETDRFVLDIMTHK